MMSSGGDEGEGGSVRAVKTSVPHQATHIRRVGTTEGFEQESDATRVSMRADAGGRWEDGQRVETGSYLIRLGRPAEALDQGRAGDREEGVGLGSSGPLVPGAAGAILSRLPFPNFWPRCPSPRCPQWVSPSHVSRLTCHHPRCVQVCPLVCSPSCPCRQAEGSPASPTSRTWEGTGASLHTSHSAPGCLTSPQPSPPVGLPPFPPPAPPRDRAQASDMQVWGFPWPLLCDFGLITRPLSASCPFPAK